MLIGYARVSTHDQNLDLQIEGLRKAGCGRIFEDKLSGKRTERPGLTKALESYVMATRWLCGNSIGWVAASRI